MSSNFEFHPEDFIYWNGILRRAILTLNSKKLNNKNKGHLPSNLQKLRKSSLTETNGYSKLWKALKVEGLESGKTNAIETFGWNREAKETLEFIRRASEEQV